MITVATKHGFGKKVGDLSNGNVSKVIMFDYLAQTFGLAGGALGRVSFIVFVLGLLVSRQWHRVAFWTLIALQLIVNSMFIIILFVQCPGHASAIWEHADKAKCWNTQVQAYYGYFQGCEYRPKYTMGDSILTMRTSLQLRNGPIPCRLFDRDILEIEPEAEDQTGIGCAIGSRDIVSTDRKC